MTKQQSDNLKLWNTWADIDPKYTKKITGKPYQGTSPSPQYVIKCLTDMFGPIGVGWGLHVKAEGFTPLADEILHWCRVEFWHTDRANTFEAYGQTKALMKTHNGLKSDEDAPKKSFTDALVKAASYIGVASNIFLGRWDDQRYVDDVKAAFNDNAPATEPEQPKDRDPVAIRDSLLAAIKKNGVKAKGNAKFQSAHNWLIENDPPKGGEITKALTDAENA